MTEYLAIILNRIRVGKQKMIHSCEEYAIVSRLACCVIIALALTVSISTCKGGEGSSSGKNKNADQPNIVFIVLDTARADRMSYNGYKNATTPFIDQLARDGVIYKNAHSVAPWTLPSHMSMFTGLLPGQHGASWQSFSKPEDMSLKDILSRSIAPLDTSQLLPQRLRDMGYSTVGITSNSWIARRTGFERGFDFFYELWNESKKMDRLYNWIPARIRNHNWFPSSFFDLSDIDKGDAGKALRVFKQHISTIGGLREPFFLFFNFIDAHFPYSPPKSWRYNFSDNKSLGEKIATFQYDEMAMGAGNQPLDVSTFSPFYDAEINYVDFAVGRLIEWLREKDYYNETLIVITSDHGEHIGENGKFSHQFSVEEELLWIPLVIKYPEGEQKGAIVENQMVSNMDIYETILQAASHGNKRDWPSTQSQNLRNMEEFDRSYLISEYYYSLPYLRANKKKFDKFSIKENSAIRRVLFDGANRYSLLERDGEINTVPSNSPVDMQGLEQAVSFLKEYIHSTGGGIMKETKRAVDKEALKQLKSLGYLD